MHGRKVVRVNDVDCSGFRTMAGKGRGWLRSVGLRGGVRRVFEDVLPRQSLASFALRFPASVIPWEFVDLIEVIPRAG